MSKVMVIAGGDWQIELIKKLKKMGHFVICSNLYENSPAFKYSDKCEIADVLDKKKNLEIAKKYMPDAIISDQSDIAVPTVAYLNSELGLKGIGVELADLFTDKSLQRQFCKKNGFDIPEYRLCVSPYDAKCLLDKYKKIIIKPIDSQSSRGVYTINSFDDLLANYKETIKWSNRRKEFIAEQYIDGDEFTVDGLVVKGKHYPLCISIKTMYNCNTNISKIQTYANYSNKFDYDKLRNTNKKLYETAKLPMGLTHSEYKYFNNKYYLIEAGARGGGSNLSAKIVPFMSGIDNYEYLINESLGIDVNEDKVKYNKLCSNKFVIMQFFDFGEGRIKKIEGKEFLTNNSVIDYQLNVNVGDDLFRPLYGRQRPGHFTIGGKNLRTLEEEANKIVNGIKVTFE